ncbi:HD domain-containing metal-dependent phosphohydrolase family protein [Striga hermonthica]|uniref:HD domain-containing metal-dependent phosphohydrolase family protein n=1 Tax=Striga hermonthica TaxID=68872 RepID=A0A9N7RBA2_STRHE|nr:HD domain-containing metal-dependent phosphohydrolase family protein [Striga hermonthica]
MGGFCSEDLSFSSNYSFSSSQDLRLSKHVHDNVHNSIYLDPLVLKFVDTEQFQRLRDLKQLGMVHMVYPGAVHSRFEHSLGVYWLAGEVVHRLKVQQGPELGIDQFDMQTVKLAGLLHDIGHGPYSHLFEREFLPKVLNSSEWSHEQMSVKMVDHIIDEHNIDIDVEAVSRVKEMILASSKYATIKSSKEKRFLYDIVANGRNGIDVDKFDYIIRDSRACGVGCNFEYQRLLMQSMRVMGDEICYRYKEHRTIHKLFATRADLFRTVYTHAKVKAIDLMLVDALISANSHLKIASDIQDPSQYWKLDDTIIKTIETLPDQELKEARDLILRIRRRDLYQYCNEYAVPKDKLENFKNVTAQDIVCSQKNGGVTLREEDVVVSNVRIDLARGRHNPLERCFLILCDHAFSCSYIFESSSECLIQTFLSIVYTLSFLSSVMFFQDYDSEDKFPISDDRVSHLLPTSYQDMIVRVYSKKPELVGLISDAFENFQLKAYGIKAQVHATPEKKKRAGK